MGYQPKIDKRVRSDVNMIFKSDEAYNIAKGISKHKHILLLRKSAGKLRQFIDCFVTTKYPAQRLIEIKYHFSKCRPEVLAIMEAMAKDPKRFEFTSSTSVRKHFIDTLHGTEFQYYDFSSNENIILPHLSINGKEFLTKIELECISAVIMSLDEMRINEYKLQEELAILEEQENVFQIYQSEKLSSR